MDSLLKQKIMEDKSLRFEKDFSKFSRFNQIRLKMEDEPSIKDQELKILYLEKKVLHKEISNLASENEKWKKDYVKLRDSSESLYNANISLRYANKSLELEIKELKKEITSSKAIGKTTTYKIGDIVSWKNIYYIITYFEKAFRFVNLSNGYHRVECIKALNSTAFLYHDDLYRVFGEGFTKVELFEAKIALKDLLRKLDKSSKNKL